MSEKAGDHNNGANAETKQKRKRMRDKTIRGKRLVDLIIFALIGLAATCGAFLSVFSYLGYWQNKESWAIWALYGVIFFTLTAGFATWQKRIWEYSPLPHVFFKSSNLKKPLTIGETVTIEFVLTNNGPADAHVRLWDNTYIFQDKPFRDRLTHLSRPADSFTVAHGQDINGEMRFDFVVTKERLTALESGKARLLFIARAEFGNGINTPTPLLFCRMYDKGIRGNLIFCPDGITIERESKHSSDRASVVIKSAYLTVFEVGKRTEALVTFVNSGGRLATNTRVYGHIQLRDKSLPADMPGAKDIGEEPSQDLVPPNGGTVLMPIRSGSELTPHLMDLINKGTHQLYIWGIVTYEDSTGERWTKFCMIQYEKTLKLSMCPNNNETDQ